MPFFPDLRTALTTPNAHLLSALFNPTNPDYTRAFAHSSNPTQITSLVRSELTTLTRATGFDPKSKDALIETVVGLFHVVYALERSPAPVDIDSSSSSSEPLYWGRAYIAQRNLMQFVVRGFGAGWGNFMLPVLYATCRYLREFAIKADGEERARRGGKADKLEDAARHLNKAFTLCLSDRAPLTESRKWGTYYIANLLFKTYFKLNSITLSKNVLRALQALGSDMPPLTAFPKSHQITYLYYVGVISFLEESYDSAETHLLNALRLLPSSSPSSRNTQLILTYLIPAHLNTTHQVPSSSLFKNYPRLRSLFGPITAAIRTGNLRAFDQALEENEEEYVKRRIYLTLERGRDVVLRNLFRQAWIIGGKKTRMEVEEFKRAMAFSMGGGNGGGNGVGGGQGEGVETEEVECLLAGLIYKGFMKGYISREKGMVVLSAKEAFPGTGPAV